MSIGIAHCNGVRESPSTEAMFAAADGALYRAKRGGRNQAVVADRE